MVAITSIDSTCKKEILGCANSVYSFQTGMSVYPDQEAMHVGDTLWIEMNIPTSQTDMSSGKIIDYSNAANFGANVGMSEIINKYSFLSAANFFDYKLVLGRSLQSPNIVQLRSFLFIEQNAKYLFKLGIVPKQKGVFGLGVSNATNVYRNSDYCTKASFLINIENSNQHYYLNPALNSSNFDTTKTSASYYFKVK